MSEQRPGVPLLDHFLARLGGAVHTARDVLDLPGLEALTQHRWLDQLSPE